MAFSPFFKFWNPARWTYDVIGMLAGTTWLQELLWLLMHDGDFKGASETPLYLRSPFIEFKDDILGEDGFELARAMDSPRVIKSHLQHRFMPDELEHKDCKVRKEMGEWRKNPVDELERGCRDSKEVVVWFFSSLHYPPPSDYSQWGIWDHYLN